MSADLLCQVVEEEDREIFVLEDCIPCPHFTDKETEALRGCDLPKVHPAQQGGALAASTGPLPLRMTAT